MLLPKQLAVSQIKSVSSYVCALPGSGKTFVNTELCGNLLANNDVTILNATFTRNAAGEMKTRLKNKIPEDKLKRIKIATLDASIVNMAKAYFKHTNQKLDLLIGPQYYLTVMRVVNEVGAVDVQDALEIIDYYLSFPSDIQYECSTHQAIIESYRRILQSKPVPTYDLKSLARLMVEKMKGGEIKPYPFTYIIVDEFQDTGMTQYEWLKLHGTIGESIIIGIGDDDQSLYRFAGSLGHANFINMKKDFAAEGYTLDTCFRCAPNILAFAESIINFNNYRVKKEFNTVDKGVNGQINIYSHNNPVDDIIPFLKVKSDNTAILCRTNRLVSDVEVALVNEGVDYQRLNGSGGLFSDFNVLAYVKLLIATVLNKNPHSLIDVFTWLSEKEAKLLFLQNYMTSQNIKQPSQLNTSELMKQGLSSITQTILINLKDWQKSGGSENVFTCQKNIINAIASAFPDKKAQKRVFSFADFITQRIKGTTFKERVERIESMLNQITDNSVEIDRTKVTLGTMHASKGLEWPTVWVLDVSQDKVPALMKESIIEAKNNESMHLEDERRLFYVACTRAEKTLNINYCNAYGMFLGQANIELTSVFDSEGKKTLLKIENESA